MSKKATENTLYKVNNILGVSDSYQAPEQIMQLLKIKSKREHAFFEFLEAYEYDLSYDWFFKYFQDEHADRKNKKQDFTPKTLSILLSDIINGKPQKPNDYCIIEEPAAGTGGTVIAHWYRRMRECRVVWNYSPDDYLYKLTELSDKTIPFLLFNLMIRGINAIVIHGDSLRLTCKEIYWVYNERNNPMGFSDIYICPHNERIEKLFGIKFEKGETV